MTATPAHAIILRCLYGTDFIAIDDFNDPVLCPIERSVKESPWKSSHDHDDLAPNFVDGAKSSVPGFCVLHHAHDRQCCEHHVTLHNDAVFLHK